MRIVTYNLQHGRDDQLCSHVIAAFDPDILLAQEVFDSQMPAPDPLFRPNAHWRAARADWGSAVYAKSGHITPLELAEFQGWLTGVQIQGLPTPGQNGGVVRAFSVHVPHQGITRQMTHATVAKMLDIIYENRGNADVIIGGDFCVDSLGDRHHSEMRQEQRWRTSRRERDILDRLRDQFGLTNCWQAANPGVPLAQTCRRAGNPILSVHCDGIFVPTSWRTKICCTVVNNELWADRRNPRSNHNPVVATIIHDVPVPQQDTLFPT